MVKIASAAVLVGGIGAILALRHYRLAPGDAPTWLLIGAVALAIVLFGIEYKIRGKKR